MNGSRVYLDSCILIYGLEGEPELKAAILSRIGEETKRTEAEFCVSDLTRLECRVGPLKRADESLLALYDTLFASQAVEQLPLNSAAFDLATELRAHHGIKTPDALHLAAAIQGGCKVFWTNDHRLSSASKNRIDLRVVP